jgi:hypothetical protein
LVLMAFVGCAVPLHQMRTYFTERAVIRRGLFRTTVVHWDRITSARSGVGYTLSTPDATIRINPYLFRDRDKLDELIARKVPATARWRG